MEPTTADEAQKIVTRCVCVSCWNQLIVTRHGDEYRADCGTCGQCRGYVSKKWVERQQQASHAEAIEARAALRESVEWMKTKQTSQELISSLGF